ncbi:MAG: ketoacyl-ACP synthase III, partial [Bacteroidetes bacterium]|nr:ketoacyl-ACP synthase III [Bacteroidota bacterium]
LGLIPHNQREAFINTTGIRYRRIAPAGMTAVDLCERSARHLMDQLMWAPSEIDLLILVTQTPDYTIPNSASIIQHRLGLPHSCIAFDINLGCSGYVYGLSVLASLLQNMPGKKGLLLVGDCSSAIVSPADKATYPLFSDAGSATALEYAEGRQWHFHLQTDGAGYEDIMVRGGAMRHPFSAASLTPHEYAQGEVRSDLQMRLDGVNIFNFALREVTPNITALLSYAQVPQERVSSFVLHQANKLIIDCVRKKLKEPEEKFPTSLYDLGNTSSASIPVTLVSQRSSIATAGSMLLSGFGVGLSWGSVILSLRDTLITELIEV